MLGEKSTDFTKELLSKSKTGIENLVLKKQKANDFFGYDDESFKTSLIDDLELVIENGLEEDKSPSLVFGDEKNYYGFIKEKSEYYVLILNTIHNNSNVTFDFEEESDGTIRLFQLSPAFEQLIHEDDIVYIIDELERSMHPLLAKELLKLYSINSNTKSQLIFTTHESHLLDDNLLRRDEIWFTEKKQDGSSDFFPLSNFNPRGDKVIERGYLQGRYGGIPFLGDFSTLTKEEPL